MDERSPKGSLLAGVLSCIVIAAGALWYLAAPPKGEDGYRERAASSAETVRSQVQVARIWVETLEDAESTHAAVAVGLRQAEADALSAANQFESYEPPSGLVELRDRYSALATEATDALAALRVAAQDEEWERLGELSRPLAPIAAELEGLEEDAET